MLNVNTFEDRVMAVMMDLPLLLKSITKSTVIEGKVVLRIESPPINLYVVKDKIISQIRENAWMLNCEVRAQELNINRVPNLFLEFRERVAA